MEVFSYLITFVSLLIEVFLLNHKQLLQQLSNSLIVGILHYERNNYLDFQLLLQANTFLPGHFQILVRLLPEVEKWIRRRISIRIGMDAGPTCAKFWNAAAH